MPGQMLRNLALVSTVTSDGRVVLELDETQIEAPGDGEILIKIDATPINPSDFLSLMGPADLSTMSTEQVGGRRILSAAAHRGRLEGNSARLDQPYTVGNEGTGIVIAVGADAEHMLGKRVSAFAGSMFCRYRRISAQGCVVLPDDTTAAEGAGLFINPLTALTMIELMRHEGHHALVHTAAASNLGQSLVRVCLADGIGLVNIVRSEAQADILRSIGARHVINSESANFEAELASAISTTGATIAFDAVGGGRLAHRILRTMELVARRGGAKGISHGSAAKKQLLVYGRLERTPLELDWDYGVNWSVGIFVMTSVLDEIGPHRAAKLRGRIVSEMRSTFASRYAATIGLADMLDSEILSAIARMETGKKYLLDPSRPVGWEA